MKWTRAVWLVMRREMDARLFSKAFVIAQVTTAALIFGIFGLGSVFGNDDPIRIATLGPQPVAAVDSLEAIAATTDIEIEVISLTNRADAEAQLVEGFIDAVVVDGRTLLMNQTNDQVVGLVGPAWQQAALIDSLVDSGLSSSEVGGALSNAAPITIEELDPDPDADARERVAFASVILMFIAIQVAGAYIMMGVFEEKSTKVVELVLSSMPARYLLAGKIIAIGVLGLVQVGVLVASSLGAASLFGSSALPALSGSLLGTAALWFLFGYLLYGAVFAAGASLAPRQEDAQSTLAPISMILMISYFAAIFTATDPQSTAAKIVSWVPFTAPFAMPGRIAANDSAWWEIGGSLLLTAVAAGATLVVAERVYVRSVIHTDRVLGWREAWSMDT